jgi:hypothetical protein
MGDECQEHSADVDMVELQQDEQMPVAGLGIVVDEKEDRNGSRDDTLSSGAFDCHQKIHTTPSSF